MVCPLNRRINSMINGKSTGIPIYTFIRITWSLFYLRFSRWLSWPYKNETVNSLDPIEKPDKRSGYPPSCTFYPSLNFFLLHLLTTKCFQPRKQWLYNIIQIAYSLRFFNHLLRRLGFANEKNHPVSFRGLTNAAGSVNNATKFINK